MATEESGVVSWEDDRSIGAAPDRKKTDSVSADRNSQGEFQSVLAQEKWWRSEVAARGGDVAGSGILAAKVPPYAKTDLNDWVDEALALWKQKDQDAVKEWCGEKRRQWAQEGSDLRKKYLDEAALERWLTERCKATRDETLVIRVQPRVFLDVEVGGQPAGRVVLQLRYDKAPRTCENFRALCTGEKEFGYAGSVFHRIIPGFMIQGGDFENGDGTGGKSIYGTKFEDENFTMKHTGRGMLSMANAGKHSNASQFFICLGKQSHLDGKHVVFGKVVDGLQVLDTMEAVGSKAGDTSQPVTIVRCGEVEFKNFT